MTDEQTRSVLLVVLGATATWLWWSGEALNYVRPGLAPYLLASGVIVGLLGLLPPLGLLGQQPAGPGDGHGGHHHRARVGWLLLAPVLVVLVVQPAALGSYAVSSRSVVPGGGDGGFPPLAAPVRGAVPMSMAEFVTRAVRDPGQSLAGVRCGWPVRRPSEGADGYRLTRFVIFCCAADAEALQAVVRGDPTPRARDQWLEVEGTWQARPAAVDDLDPAPPVLQADLVRPVAPPWPPSTPSSSAAEGHQPPPPAPARAESSSPMGWLALAPNWVVACSDAVDEGSLSGHAGSGRGDRPGRAGVRAGPVAAGRAAKAGGGWPG